jgi:hypothetical protein
VREYQVSDGCEVDVMHAQERSILRQSIRREIVYYYPFEDYKAIIIFNAVIMLSVGDPVMEDYSGIVPEKANPAGITAVFHEFSGIYWRIYVCTKKGGSARAEM